MATMSGTGLTFPDSSVLSGIIGTNYIAKWATATQVTHGSSQDAYLNLEVVMPAPKTNNSKYLVMAEVHCDDTNSGGGGVGLSIWVDNTASSYWVNQQGTHADYYSGGADHYWTIQSMIMDDGNVAQSPAINTSQRRKYRLYGDNHNGNMYFCTTNVGGRIGWTGYLFVCELDGGLF